MHFKLNMIVVRWQMKDDGKFVLECSVEQAQHTNHTTNSLEYRRSFNTQITTRTRTPMILP